MAHRTKGFPEQDHASKTPTQWHRQARPVLTEASVNIQTARSAMPANAAAESKLKTFQFATAEAMKHVSRDNDDKENILGSQDDTTRVMKGPDLLHAISAQAGVTPKLPSLPHANTFPCTPSGRLSLEDLIGDGDEPSRTVATVDESPEEHVGWNPHSSAFTPNRKRKRARSSSPSYPNTSSQPLDKSALVGDDPTVLDAKIALEADPVAALWQAYQGKQADNNLGLPDFDHLIVQASPRPMETPVKGSGLRRWASTGNDWPSTKNKRRCLSAATTVNSWRKQHDNESGSKSRVASMVQKIQESLATQRLEQAQTRPMLLSPDCPSSSSPLPDTEADDGQHTMAPASPLKSRTRQAILSGILLPGKDPVAEVPKPKSCPVHAPREQSIERSQPLHREGVQQETLISAPLHLQSKGRLPAYKRPSIARVPTPPKAASAKFDEFDDEFEDAFDLTADDLDELMSQVPVKQSTLNGIPPHPDLTPQNQPLPMHDPHAQPILNLQITIDEGEDDEFGCDDIDEAILVQAEFSATQTLRKSPRKESLSFPKPAHSVRHIRRPSSSPTTPGSESSTYLSRYTVKQVVDGEYVNARGMRCPEKLLLAEDHHRSLVMTITLRGSWLETSVSRGDVVHVASMKRSPSEVTTHSHPPGQTLISDDQESPFLVTHPDHMLSATTVADSFDCIRKAVLQDRIKATGETNKAMVYGKILHEIFQQALSVNRWDDRFLSELAEVTVHNHVEGLWELGMCDTNLAIEEIRAKMGELAGWANVFVMPEPSHTSLVDDQQGDKVRMSVSRLIAIEEHVWSPQYGLKGNIDATVETSIVQSSGTPSRLLAPLEVKTGRTTQSAAHRAQTALYTLLLSDRYDLSVTAGILYYLESSSTSRVAPPVNEIRQMVQQRNRLAAYIHSARNPLTDPGKDDRLVQSQEIESSGLPNLLKNPFKCGRCYANQSCLTYHALQENGTAESAGMIDDARKDHSLVWKEVVGHLMLTTKDQQNADLLRKWFSKWDRLLTFEESEQSKLRKELWTMSSSERESVGRCFGRLILARDLTSPDLAESSTAVDGIEGSGGKINRFTYAFTRSQSSPGQSFAEGSHLTAGEPVVVSSETGQWALANGYVIAVTKNDITVAVDRRLGVARQRLDNFNIDDNQAFKGIMTTDTSRDEASGSKAEIMLYRLDKDEFSNGLALVRNNLVSLMSTHPIHTKLRSQIVLATEPEFATSTPTISLPLSQLGQMNDDQRAAVRKVMSAKDYALILGMPGTGKTTTIAHIIRSLLADGQSILLTSFTHTAVDNILLKIRDIAPNGSILRLGVPAKINDQVKEFCQLAATPRKTIDEIEQAYMRTQIVATTCMGTNHALFHRRAFDVCIVDEASQITLPTILGPLLHARKFILVGDHYQLPPLVQNRAALAAGLDVSLFRQLSEAHPSAVASLGLQYRMCADIMSLPNALIYSGQLRCGTPAVASRSLCLPFPDALLPSSSSSPVPSALFPHPLWLSHLTSPSTKVLLANTDTHIPSSRECVSGKGQHITNLLEARLATVLVSSFLALGVDAPEIGVIALYRSQLSLLRTLFRKAGIAEEVEIDSADRFQGRDKECVILSMVRSNEAGVVGELLKDWRRVNVALTRARSKLVILGSKGTLGKNELLREMMEIIEGRGWETAVPKDLEVGLGEEKREVLGGGSKGGERSEETKDRSESKARNTNGNREVLGPLRDGGNSARKAQPRVIEGKKGAARGLKARVVREQVAREILDEL